MKTKDIHRAEPRRDLLKSHLIAEEVHDPYKASKKPHQPTRCPQCGAVNLEGRWQWPKDNKVGLHEDLCPACRRANDKYPAGEIILGGGFLAAHRDEIVKLARNTERAESAEHPLQRIMSIEDSGDEVVITTTDIHLPRRIAHAIVDAYKGELDMHYDRDGYFVRAKWRRES
jgi:hypothetical protein